MSRIYESGDQLPTYLHVQKDKCAVLHPHYDKCVFIGYPDGYKGWKFYNLTIKCTIISEHADFNEHPANSVLAEKPAVVHDQPIVNTPDPYAPPDLPGDVDDDQPVVAPEMPPPQRELLDEDDDEPAPPLPAPLEVPAPPVPPPPRAPSPIGIAAYLPVRNCQKPQDWWKLSSAQLVDDPEESKDEEADTAQEECLAVSSAHPRSFTDAMHRDNASEWKAAALAELDAHKTNGTWILVSCPEYRLVIGSK